ncbi:hypothetical protein D3C80_1472350 [compost metagenome]
MQQVFTLEVQRGIGAFGQVATFGQRRRAARVVFQQVGEFGLESRILLGANKRFFELAQGRHQNLRNVHTTELAEIRI